MSAEAYKQLKLLNALAAAISSAPTVDDAVGATLRTFCEAADWSVGQVWLPDAAGEVLFCGPVWYQKGHGLAAFRQASEAITFGPGESFLGAVWSDGQSRWSDEIGVDTATFRRSAAAAACGLKGVLVVPVSSNGEVTAVLEFLTREHDEMRADLRGIIAAAAAQLSSLIAQKAAQTELRRSEAMFRAVADTANDCIVSIDSAGRITYVNPEGSRLFGYPDGALVGAPVTDLIPKRLHEAHAAGFARFLATGQGSLIGSTASVPGRCSDGSEIALELSLATWGADDACYFTAIIRDVSERQRMQAELERALVHEQDTATRLQELDRLKNTFLDAVSHDLRGPVAAMRATTGVLRRDANQPFLTAEQRCYFLGGLEATLDKMRRLIEDLLNMERLNAGEALSLASVDLADLMRAAVEEHQGTLGSRPIEFALHPVVAHVDAAKIERIIENLLLNACRHTPLGTQVRLSVERDGSDAVICVDDAGPGVAEEMRSLIFERFRQQPGSSGEGVGMGLSLVARLAAMHGGQAWVEERPGGGAAFRVSLPVNGSAHSPQIAKE